MHIHLCVSFTLHNNLSHLLNLLMTILSQGKHKLCSLLLRISIKPFICFFRLFWKQYCNIYGKCASAYMSWLGIFYTAKVFISINTNIFITKIVLISFIANKLFHPLAAHTLTNNLIDMPLIWRITYKEGITICRL